MGDIKFIFLKRLTGERFLFFYVDDKISDLIRKLKQFASGLEPILTKKESASLIRTVIDGPKSQSPFNITFGCESVRPRF